jgi:hypothetical protein
MLKRLAVLMCVFVLLGGQAALAQEPTPEPGPGAASELPPASVLGEGWTQYDVVSPAVLGQYSFEMTPDVFSEGAAGLYSGPDGARVVVVNLIVTDSRVAVRASWEDATELTDRLTWGVDSDYRRQEALDTMVPPAGCVEAKRVEGTENTYLTPVGATMCAQDPDNVWIFLVSGTLNGTTGVAASDALVEATLSGGSIGTPAT